MDKLAVRLRPGAVAGWLGVPAHTLADQTLPLDALWGREARELLARLAEAPGRAAQRALVETALLARAPCVAEPVATVEAAVAAILAAADVRRCAHSHASSARANGASSAPPRARRPRAEALPAHRPARERPRVLARGASQLEAALAAGYHDQAHLHRDCQALAGVGPSAL